MFERLVWLIPVLVAGAGLRSPRGGLVVLAAALPLFGSPPGGPYLGALEAAGLAAVVTAWRGGRADRSPLTAAVLAIVVVSLASLVPPPYQPPSWRPGVLIALLGALPGVENASALYTVRAAGDLLLGCALFFAIRRSFAGRSVRPIALGLGVGLILTLTTGLASLAGLFSLDAYRPIQGFRQGNYRLQSFFFLSGWLAEYLVMAAPFALSAMVVGTRRHTPWVIASLTLLAAALALTFQRGAWVAVAAQLAVAVYLTRSRWRAEPGRVRQAVISAAVLVVLTGLLLLGSGERGQLLLDRARSIDTGVTTRVSLWNAAVEMFVDRPLLGWGLGSYTPAFDLLHPPGSEGAHPFRGTAHNLYLHVAAERGALGLLALALLGAAAFSCLREPRSEQRLLALGLTLSLVGTAIYGLVQYMFHLRNISWLFWILLGCAAVVDARRSSQKLVVIGRVVTFVAVLAIPLRLALVEPAPLGDTHTFGFHAEEGSPGESFRWTEGYAATRIPWTGEALALSLANGHPQSSEHTIHVTVGVDGERLATLTATGDWREHRFEIGAPRADFIVVTLEAHPTFRPFNDFRRYPELPLKSRRTGDIRALGVAVRAIRTE